MHSVLQDWVMELPLREQGTLLTCVRGCDNEPKIWTSTGVAYSPGRRLTAYIRWCFMNPADPREVDSQEGAFMMSMPPGWLQRRDVNPDDFANNSYPVIKNDKGIDSDWVQVAKFKPSEFGHLPQHWYSHAMHALEIIGYRHPDQQVAGMAYKLYRAMVENLHLNHESFDTMITRLSEDRIVSGTVVS